MRPAVVVGTAPAALGSPWLTGDPTESDSTPAPQPLDDGPLETDLVDGDT